MTDWKGLAARCEQATGPDRRLDRDISEALDIGPIYKLRGKIGASWPDYTASLDAALTLVPEGWRVRDFGDWEDRWLITLMNEDTGEEVKARADAGLPALALCAASLKARDNG